jgi:WD40 repeat protein
LGVESQFHALSIHAETLVPAELMATEFTQLGEVLCLAVSADGKTIAAGGGDKTVSVWTAP